MWVKVVQSGSKGRILGEFEHSLDDKGRLSIPARYRAAFAEGAVVTRGFEPCLVLYPMSEWDAWADKVNSLPAGQEDARQLMRLVFSSANEVELDKLGRVNVPAYLRRYAGLGGEVTLVGVGSRFEIWERGRWDANRLLVEEHGAEIARQLDRYGI
ncbi:MAG: division/cell wall cluster transcriptional repressor MraZ [Chloroflexi bacterium]|nr:division/cell wall cluster transcriptional repressor MraZ [Chloroflexota bacterium]